MKWRFSSRDGGLLKGKVRDEQHAKVEQHVKPIDKDDIIHDVFNVVMELRVNADNLEEVLRKLREEADGTRE